MVFPIVGGDGKPTGYEMDNSLRFNDDDSARLTLDPGTSTNNKKLVSDIKSKLLKYVYK